jgi:hypothetical protein
LTEGKAIVKKVKGWRMDFVMRKGKKESRGFIACDRNFDIKVGRAVLVSNYYLTLLP